VGSTLQTKNFEILKFFRYSPGAAVFNLRVGVVSAAENVTTIVASCDFCCLPIGDGTYKTDFYYKQEKGISIEEKFSHALFIEEI
jgi:hypothetical protein